MIVPPVSGLGGAFSVSQIGGLTQGAGAGEGVGQGEGLGQGTAVGQSEPSLTGPAGTGGEGGFGGALTNAISSLEQTQQSADGASQALASGTASSPESAVLTVQDAQLEMQLAAQIRTKAVEAAQSIFQTQV